MDKNLWTAPDQSFTKIITKAGTGLEKPNEGTRCQIKINVNIEDNVQAGKWFGYETNKETSVIIGDGIGELSCIVDGALETMRLGESCCINVAPVIVSSLQVKGQIITNSEAEMLEEKQSEDTQFSFVLHLIHFERSKDIHDLDLKEVVERMGRYKNAGSECFKAGNLTMAEKFYIRALKYAISISEFIPEDEEPVVVEKFWTIHSLCLLNFAACQLKGQRYEDVIKICTKAILIDKTNPKAFFRRGQAHMALQDYELAMDDFKAGLKLEPSSRPLQEQLRILQARIKKLEEGYAKSMKKLFD